MKQSLNYARPPSGQRRLRRTRSDRLLGMISSPVRVRDGSPEPRRLGPNDLTPVHQRTSRRLRGEPPEFPLLREPAKEPPAVCGGNTEMTSPVAATHVIVDQPRTPEPFHGDTQQLNSNPTTISSLAEVVREEVRQAVREQQPQAQPQASLPVQPAISYAEVLRGTPGRTFVTASTHLPEPRFTPPPPEMRRTTAPSPHAIGSREIVTRKERKKK
ncbi:hypothetical protein HPB52_023885 [Rhipicephalus sanguineus]|uniref:Uncharacterized protein n=1 Tax=Rhipicephalus sanguineus TaxID=34632 RepID=A0A9D4TC94_RHISA|nr:hypothetical protein HPB52_023885 [Rhipicephalus sanguineus]